MKKNLFWKMTAVALVCAVIVTACEDFSNLEDTTNQANPKPQGGYGMVSISFGGGGIARTLLPTEIDISKLYYVLNFKQQDGAGDITKKQSGSGQLNVQLAGGIWDLVIYGYNSESDAADTSKALVFYAKNDIVVEYGGNVKIDAKLETNLENLTQTGSGTLRYDITFPTSTEGVLKIYTSPANIPVNFVVLPTMENQGSLELASGYYNISVIMEYQGKVKIWGSEIVHINDNAITEAVIGPNGFTDYLPSLGNVDISLSIDKFTMTDEGAGIFSNESPIVLDKKTGDTRIISVDDLAVVEWRVGDVVLGTRNIITLNPMLFPSGTYTLNLVFLKNGKYWLGSIRFDVIDNLTGGGGSTEDSSPIIDASCNPEEICQDDYLELWVSMSSYDEPAIAYQWYVNSVNSYDGGTFIPGAYGESYSPPTDVPGTFYYYVRVALTSGEMFLSQRIMVVVTPRVQAPVITTQPVGGLYGLNDPTTPLRVTANVYDEGQLSYQWYESYSDSNSGGAPIYNATQASYSPPTDTQGVRYYYCEVTNTIQVGGLISTMSVKSNTTYVGVNVVPLNITGLSVVTKVYDGTTTATLTGTPELPPSARDVALIQGTAEFASANVGSGISVTLIGWYLAGAGSMNYFLQLPTNLTGNITKAAGSSVTTPVVDYVTGNSITVNVDFTSSATVFQRNEQIVEYAISSNGSANVSTLTWQDSPTLTGLESVTTYYVYARSKQSQNCQAGGYVVSDAIQTTNPIVSFDTAGGIPIIPISVPKNQPLAENGISTTKPGYVFDYWYTDADGTQPYNFANPVQRSFTLYARWINAAEKSQMEQQKNMVFIPGGWFRMGSPYGGSIPNISPTTPYPANEDPQHSVGISGFWMGKYEVTQEEWERVMMNNPSNFTTAVSGEYNTPRGLPVENISWYAALVYCNKLSIAEFRQPVYKINNSTYPTNWGPIPTARDANWDAVEIVEGSDGYRLPTEAQWEYACRAGAVGFNFSTNTGGTNTWSANIGWSSNESGGKTHQVGMKSANARNLYDMHGNVSEWCWDLYGNYSNTSQINPTGSSSGNNRVTRGGSWNAAATNLRSAFRGNSTPYNSNNSIGLRVVRPNN
jgi:uncharacterized repeat protein (TIGR02543 family)